MVRAPPQGGSQDSQIEIRAARATRALQVKRTPKTKVARRAARSRRKTAKKANPSSEHKHEKRKATALISRGGGVTLAELAKKMDWELHTTRGVISVLGSKHGIKIESFKNGAGEQTHRIK